MGRAVTRRSGQRPAGRPKSVAARLAPAAIALAVAALASACSLNPFSDDEEQVGRLADSAARASLQTYGLLTRAVKRHERLAARRADEESSEAPRGGQIAALPPTSDPAVALRVRFSTELAELDPAARVELAALSAQLQGSADIALKLLAYWSADDEDEAATAKLKALKRAMLVRDFLTDQGLGRAPIEFPRVEDDDIPLDFIDVVIDRS